MSASTAASMVDLEISPHTRVGALLAWPELEQVLLEYAPAFEKLKNPVLRRTVARVATLRQAAELAGVEVSALVVALQRAARGEAPRPIVQGLGAGASATAGAAPLEPAAEELPGWVEEGRAVLEIDADESLERGEHPLGEVQRRARLLAQDEHIRVDASFKPVPLMDALAAQGCRVHAAKRSNRWSTWIARAEGANSEGKEDRDVSSR
jgi:hypothetical protein